MWPQYKYNSLPLSVDSLPPSAAKSAKSDTWLLKFCHTVIIFLCFLFMIITLPFSIWCSIKIVPDYERMVIFRLGRVRPPKGPGWVLVIPLIDQLQRVDMRTRTFSIRPSKVKSRDDVLVSLRADVHFRVCDPVLSVMSVQDLNFVIQHTAENLLTQSLGRKYLREIYGGRARIAEHLKEDINEEVKLYGVCIDHTELHLEAVLRPHEEPVNVPITPPTLGSPAGLEQMIFQLVSLAQQTLITDSSPSPVVGSSIHEIASRINGVLSESLVAEVGSSYQLNVTQHRGETISYFIDLTSGSGSCSWGVFPGTPDVTLQITEDDLLSLINGDLSPFAAYTTGRLHVEGDLNTALELKKVFSRLAER